MALGVPQPFRVWGRAAAAAYPGGPVAATTSVHRTPLPAWAGGAALGLGLWAILMGTLAAGRVVALIALVLFVIGIFLLSATGRTGPALILFIAYSAMEGFFKYLTDFSQAVYVIKPLLMLLIAAGSLLLRGGIVGGGRVAAPQKQRRRRPAAPLLPLICAFGGWAILMVLHPLGGGIAGGIATALVWYVLPLAVYFLAFQEVGSRRRLEQFFFAFLAICTVVSAFGLLQYVMGRGWTEAHLPGYERIGITSASWFVQDQSSGEFFTGWRPASTTPLAGGGAGWGHLGVLLSAGLMFSPAISGRAKLGVLLPCLLVNVVGVSISGVRLYIVVGMVEALLILAFASRTSAGLARNLGIGTVGAGAVLGAFLFAQVLSGGVLARRYEGVLANPFGRFQKERGQNFTYLPSFIAENPIGIGYQRGTGGFDQVAALKAGGSKQAGNRETQFNSIAADMGVPGLLLLLALLVGVVAQGWSAMRRVRAPHLRAVGATLFALIAGTCLVCLGGPALQGADYFWLLAALLFALPGIEQRERAMETANAPLVRPRITQP